MNTIRRARMRLAAIAAFLALAAGLHPADAQTDWPRRPITMIVSQSAGASPDVFARHLSERLRIILNQPVIVENKPAAATPSVRSRRRGRHPTDTPSSSRHRLR